MNRRDFVLAASASVVGALPLAKATSDPAGTPLWSQEDQRKIIDIFRKRLYHIQRLNTKTDYYWSETDSNKNLLWIIGADIWVPNLHLNYPNDLGIVSGWTSVKLKEKDFSYEKLFQKMGVGLGQEVIRQFVAWPTTKGQKEFYDLTINNLVWDHEGFWKRVNQLRDKKIVNPPNDENGVKVIVPFFIHGTYKRPPLELVQKTATV